MESVRENSLQIGISTLGARDPACQAISVSLQTSDG